MTDDAMALAVDAAPTDLAFDFLLQRARELRTKRWAENTVKAYERNALHFERWCKLHGRSAIPCDEETLIAWMVAAAYGTHGQAQLAANSIRVAMAGIRFVHHVRGYAAPTNAPNVVATFHGMLNTLPAPEEGTPIQLPNVLRVLAVCQSRRLHQLAAVVALSYAGALRVGEAAGLKWTDVDADGGYGVRLRVRASKRSKGTVTIFAPRATRYVAACPLNRLNDHAVLVLQHEGRLRGNVFYGVRRIQQEVAALVEALGIQGASPHSFRNGWAQDASAAGVPLVDIQAHLRHATLAATQHYVRASWANAVPAVY